MELLPKFFDHTILKADAVMADIERLCHEAVTHDFASVCVNGCYTKAAADLLKGSQVKVCTVIGFPLGAMSAAAKCQETMQAVADGAQEIDMVINVGALKDHRDDDVGAEIKAVRQACGDKAILKVIIEACLLTDEEKVRACLLAKDAGAEFVKTSTGFSSGGATEADVALMRQTVGADMGVKASGGIRSRRTAEAMIAAGASRLGTSATIEIIKG